MCFLTLCIQGMLFNTLHSRIRYLYEEGIDERKIYKMFRYKQDIGLSNIISDMYELHH